MSTNADSQKGFTLVEVAVVVPMMILIVLSMLALLILLVNSVALPTKRNTLVNAGEKAFAAISTDVTNGAGFLDSVPGTYSDPQSSDYSSPPSGTQVLMIQGYNQIKDPTDTTGTKTLPAFKGAGPCSGTTTIDKSNVAGIIAIYFVKNGTLWRRVLTESSPGATCGTLLINQTCQPGPSPPCSYEDTPIAKDNVTGFTITYYDSTSGTTLAANNAAAKSILVTVVSTINSGGDNTSTTSSVRISQISS